MSVQLIAEGRRIYLAGNTFPIKDKIKSLGGHWDGDRRMWWLGIAKAEDAKTLCDAAPADDAPREPQKPDDIRLTGKGRYKGREYFAGSITRDGAKVRLLTLPDASGKFLDFWAPCSEVEQTKSYAPREHTYRGHTTIRYTTLGSIADFIKDRREADKQIAAGEIPAGYCVDLEDGMVKPIRECDMPSV